ncbi:hypothetical protein BC832DRAFT_460548 [Gaertneriomyces semiglobifer]|nr:hypothetical protein BC832DRAFT_460548 [Gaertneriomyces semiglobifer]
MYVCKCICICVSDNHCLYFSVCVCVCVLLTCPPRLLAGMSVSELLTVSGDNPNAPPSSYCI